MGSSWRLRGAFRGACGLNLGRLALLRGPVEVSLAPPEAVIGPLGAFRVSLLGNIGAVLGAFLGGLLGDLRLLRSPVGATA